MEAKAGGNKRPRELCLIPTPKPADSSGTAHDLIVNARIERFVMPEARRFSAQMATCVGHP